MARADSWNATPSFTWTDVSAATRADATWPIVWKSAALAVALFAVAVIVVFPAFVLELVLPDQTVYAAGFSDERLGQVRPGMKAQDVLTILGPPLAVAIEPADRQTYVRPWKDRPSDTTGARRIWWEYSKHGRLYGSYNVRAVEFTPDGKVVAVEQHYYQD